MNNNNEKPTQHKPKKNKNRFWEKNNKNFSKQNKIENLLKFPLKEKSKNKNA